MQKHPKSTRIVPTLAMFHRGTVVKLGEAGEKVTKEKCRVGGMVKEKAPR